MPPDSTPPAAPARAPDSGGRLGNFLLWLLLAAAIVTFPRYPQADLDASWRMSLGWFFHEGLQMGRDIVFTYGPLGYVMGRTYWGLQFGSLVLWQVFSAAVFAVLIIAGARDLRGTGRFVYFAFFVLLGVTYEDALHMIVIALAGWELVRRTDDAVRADAALLALLLALLAIVKFTNLMLAAVCVAAAGLHALWRGRRRPALLLTAWFAGGYLVLWMLCGQNPLNLPRYLLTSLEVSRGYQEAMGLPTPPDAFWKGVTVLVLLIGYAGLYVWGHPDRPRALANGGILAALIYLNWKHGFVRADGHMIGFFFCALLPIVGFPALLADGPRWRRLQRVLLVPAGILCVAGTYDALSGVVRYASGQMQDKLWDNVSHVLHWRTYRQTFDNRLREQKQAADLPRVRATVGRATVDVIGYEQAFALFNGLNYHPRPVFQSYSAYTPRLARLNEEFYASARAPQFALLKVETIDERLAAFDDSRLLNLLLHAYEYQFSEKGFQLWRRKAAPPDPATIEPRRIRAVTTGLDTPCPLDDLAGQHVWATVDVPLSWLGRLRDTVYKPPFARLVIELQDGSRSEYRLPLLQAQTGFMLNPLVNDVTDLMNFAGGKPDRWVRSISVAVAPADRRYFTGRVRVTTFALTPSTAGAAFFRHTLEERFWMFKTCPVSFQAFAAPSEVEIDGRKAMVLHAPSEMLFVPPRGAQELAGAFGYPPGAYQGDGKTDGAIFRVVWDRGGEQAVLFSRHLQPRDHPADRGLQSFRVDLRNVAGGQLRLEVNPGPYNDTGWDWTAWTEIEIK